MARSVALVVLLVPPLVAGHAAADDKPSFRVEVAPPARCAVAAPCEARIKLTALGDYKVNEEYPFKFVADANAAVAIDGAKFARAGEKTGTLTITLRAQSAGKQSVTGTFKLSVCTKDICKIEAPKVTFAVPVT